MGTDELMMVVLGCYPVVVPRRALGPVWERGCGMGCTGRGRNNPALAVVGQFENNNGGPLVSLYYCISPPLPLAPDDYYSDYCNHSGKSVVIEYLLKSRSSCSCLRGRLTF